MNNLPVNKAETAVLKFLVVACAEAAPRVRAPRIPSQKPAACPSWSGSRTPRSEATHEVTHSPGAGAGPHNWSFHLLRPRSGASRRTPARPPGPTERLRQGSMRDAMGQGRGTVPRTPTPSAAWWMGRPECTERSQGVGVGRGSLGSATVGRLQLTSAS